MCRALGSKVLQTSPPPAVLLPPSESVQAAVVFDPRKQRLEHISSDVLPVAVETTLSRDMKSVEGYSGSLKIATASGVVQVRSNKLGQAHMHELCACVPLNS